jgi:hypothetical protein
MHQMGKNKMTMTIAVPVTEVETLWNAPVNAGPYKRSDAVITREFIALQSKQRASDLIANAPNWFGVPAGVFATLRRPTADGVGKLGKNGWTAELLVDDGKSVVLMSGLTIGAINALPASAFVRIVNVHPADPVAIVSHFTGTGFVRGSQRLPDADRNPATGAILKPDMAVIPAVPADASTVIIPPVSPAVAALIARDNISVDADGVVTEPAETSKPNRKQRRAAKRVS